MRREWEQAVRRGAVHDLTRLLAAGADIDSRDGHGQTALMRAACRGQHEIVSWLVEQSASLDHTAKYGLSALMLAVINGHTDVVRVLVAAGANVHLAGTGAPGFAGRTALDLATDRGDRDMVEALRGARPDRQA